MPIPLVAALMAACTPAASESMRDVDVQELHRELEAQRVSVLVDVRTPAEFASGHVPGAVNIPLDAVGQTTELDGLESQEIYLICQSGGRSSRAQQLLSAKSFTTINVRGGTAAWRAAGFPVE